MHSAVSGILPVHILRTSLLRWTIPAITLAAVAAWLALAPEGALGKLDAIGYAVCHRIETRSFAVDGRQLPLCARCTGEFGAAAVAVLFQAGLRRRAARFPAAGILAVFGILFLIFAVDGLNSFLFLLAETSGGAALNAYAPSNTLRLFTGSGMGIAMAGVLFPALGQIAWRDPSPAPSLNWRELGLLASVVVAWDLLIMADLEPVLYTAAGLSTLGVLMLLGSVFAMLWISVMRMENAFVRTRDLWLPAGAGLTLALLMVAGIDFVRFQATGTWGGFPGLAAT